MSETGILEQSEPFQPDAFGILFFSRGRGRGHVVPDMAIDRELRQRCPNLDLRFVSYSGGANALRACGYNVIDLQTSDEPLLWDAIVSQTRIAGCLQPQLIISHEEIPALVAAQVFGIPCAFITDFFLDPSSIFMRALDYASEIIFTAEPGIYCEPPFLRAPVTYVGPAIRRFQYGRADRERARQELGIAADATVVFCQAGNWPESQVPMANLLMGAWEALPCPSKHLIWMAVHDFESLQSRLAGRPDITLIKEDWKIDRLFAASDLLITKANRLTVYEAASLGLPSISISNSANWPDDAAVARVRSNTALQARGLAPEALAQLMVRKIAGGWVEVDALPKWNGIAGASRIIARRIESIRGVAENAAAHPEFA